jgi:hypothetical protein
MFIYSHTIVQNINDESMNAGTPVLYQKITIPKPLQTQSADLVYGGDIRIGDFTGNGQVDFLVYRAAEGNRQGATKPCFLGAFTSDGKILWQKGDGGIQPYRPGPVAIHDMDNDGQSEVVCFFHEPQRDADPFSLHGVTVQILDGKTGQVEKQKVPEIFSDISGEGPNWVHQRILITNFRGTKQPQDFIVKLGKTTVAFDNNLNVLWTYFNPWDEYQNCPAYIPAVGDIDNDGKDEVNGGYFLLDDDGTIMWEKKLGKNMDAVAIAEWDDGYVRAFCSGYGHIMDKEGNVVLKLGEQLVPHGQELRVADFDSEMPGPEMIIRYNGHKPDAMLVNNNGTVVNRYQLNESPNNTGMTEIYWNGHGKPTLLFNGGVLWRGNGQLFAELPDLPPPVGNKKMGWYHCIPANGCGDDREEIITYNPWDKHIYIFTPAPFKKFMFERYIPGPRQYNVRLMD